MLLFLVNVHIPILPSFVGSAFLAPIQYKKPKIANGPLSANLEKMRKLNIPLIKLGF